jgi:hypothetical protein
VICIKNFCVIIECLSAAHNAAMEAIMTKEELRAWCQSLDELPSTMPKWAERACDKIWEVLKERAPDPESAIILLFAFAHALHAEYFSDGDQQAAALDLADIFTKFADAIGGDHGQAATV